MGDLLNPPPCRVSAEELRHDLDTWREEQFAKEYQEEHDDMSDNGEALNIYQRINEVRKMVNYARKDKEVAGQGYKAVTHDAVTALVRNHLIEHGVLVVPRLMSSDITHIGETKNGTPVIRYAGRFEIDFINCDEPNDRITLPVEAHANDHGDKAPGKAISYATKYAELKMFNIETGEDEESRVEPYGGFEKISEEQALSIEAKIAENELDREAFMKWAKIDDITEIRAKSFGTVVKQIDAAIQARQAKARKVAKNA